tara:strand:+ start:646 stop:2109 length:1464 start_codon:yes stop_codon:yes gene_type:complete
MQAAIGGGYEADAEMPSADNKERAARVGPYRYIVLAALPIAIAGLEQSIMATSATTIAQMAGAETGLVWILAAFFIPASVATIVLGQLGDSFGPMRMLVYSLLIFAAGSLLAAQAPTYPVLLVARFVQGVGGGGLLALPQAFLAQRIPPRDRAAFQGYLVAVAFFANTFGPVVGSLLIAAFGWQSVFYALIPMALTAAAILWQARRRSRPARPPVELNFDWWGTLFLIISVCCIILASQTLAEPDRIGLALIWIGGFVLSLAVMILWMRAREDALVPLELVRIPMVWKCGLVAFLYGALFTGVVSLFPLLFRDYYGLDLRQIGLVMMPFLGAVGVGSILTGLLVRKTGRMMIFPAIGLAVFACSMIGLALFMDRLGAWQTAIALGTAGMWMGTTLNVVNISVQANTPPDMMGRATAFVQLSRTVGASLGVGLGTLVYFRSLNTFAAGCTGHCDGSVRYAFALLLCFFALLSMSAALVAHRARRFRLS